MLTKIHILRVKGSAVVEDRLEKFHLNASLVRRNCIDAWLFFFLRTSRDLSANTVVFSLVFIVPHHGDIYLFTVDRGGCQRGQFCSESICNLTKCDPCCSSRCPMKFSC